MKAARVLTACYKCGIFSVLPINEGQARELGRLKDPADWIEVWRRVVSSTAPEDITAEVAFNHVLGLLDDRAEQTPDEHEPVYPTLGSLDAERCDAAPGHEAGEEPDVAVGNVVADQVTVNDAAQGGSETTVAIANRDDRSVPDGVEPTDHNFDRCNPVAIIYGTMADGHEYPCPTSWPLSPEQLIAAYAFQRRSTGEQRSRLRSARINPTDATNQGLEAIMFAFEVLMAAGVIEHCEDEENLFSLSRPGMDLAAAAAAIVQP